ncbi:MAG: hypothetical protein M1834_005498 [Cirrosporium novae-zelandiae]|nr:MAG: hypothetical protein M1834_005498 [Cirrosporium novae-zelandiae]
MPPFSKVEEWLSSIPEQEQEQEQHRSNLSNTLIDSHLARSDSPTQIHPTSPKKRRASVLSSMGPSSKRRMLSDHNSPSPVLQAPIDLDPISTSPSPSSTGTGENGDINITPRPRKSTRHLSQRSSTTSTTTSRSRSSIKRKIDYDLSYPEIRFQAHTDLPDDATELYDQLDVVAYQLPLRFKVHLQNFRPKIQLRGYEFIDDELNSPNPSCPDLWTFITEIRQATSTCHDEERAEDSWSDEVIYPILRKSIEYAGLRNKVAILNMKAVSVDPSYLLPIYNGISVPAKKIDYTFCLNVSDQSHLQLIGDAIMRSDADHPSVNQTTEKMLRKRPIFSNLEIKKLHAGQNPEIQLGTWCAAGFAKLYNLSHTDETLVGRDVNWAPKSIPVWAVEGDKWSLYIASKPTADKVIIQGPLRVFSTFSFVDIISIVNVLARVYTWATTVYEQWFLDLLNDSALITK